MKRVFLALIVVLIGVAAWAQTSTTATLSVTVNVQGSLKMTIESLGGTTGGLATTAATTNLGNVSAYGSIPAGFVRTYGPSYWRLTNAFSFKVVQANMASTGFMLSASLSSAAASGVTWSIANYTISTTPMPVGAYSQYDSAITCPLAIQITNTAPPTAGALNRTITLLIVSS